MSTEGNLVTSIDEAVEQMVKPMNFYNEPAFEGEMDLVKELRDRFIEQGATNELLEQTFDLDRFVKEAQGKHTASQQFLLNRYMADELMRADMAGRDTREERFSLIYNIPSDKWLRIAEQKIIPNLLDMGLPGQD